MKTRNTIQSVAALLKAVFALTLLVCACCLSGCVSRASHGGAQDLVFDFESDSVEALPKGWSEHQWGSGSVQWRVQQGDAASGKILAQLAAENPNKHFNIAVFDGLLVADVALSVRFKAVSGQHDQGGGFVWRYQDERNHYIVRANPLENNVVAYKMENGVRTDLALVGQGRTYGVTTAPMGMAWHRLELKATGPDFTVAMDGKELFRVRDASFSQPGKVGLWTKADAVTWFDHFQVKSME